MIITPERLPPGQGWVLFAMSAADYENLARTQAETLRWIQEATHLLDRCTRPPE